jgi:hypothetical protein
MTAVTKARKPSARSKDGLVRLPIDDIEPAAENLLVYRPVCLDDPEIINLAISIRDHGLQEPILVTSDHFILSGHRRHAACRLAGLTEIPCRVVKISRYDPRFETLLVECNRQRVKSFDEVVRECLVGDSGDDAYESLLAYRKAVSAVSGEFLEIQGRMKRKRISDAKSPMLRAIIEILDSHRDHWPMIDRSIHYCLLNDPPLRHASKPHSRYQNDKASYKDLTDLLTRARLEGRIPFEAISDPTRTVELWGVDRDVGAFFRRKLDGFLQGYWRDRQQSQPNHIEIVVEKLTVEGSIKNVAGEYCLPYTVGRGQCSLDPRHKMWQRFLASGKDKLIVLMLSDFDPDGEAIAHAYARSMRDDFGITNVLAKKVCLTHEQVLERNFRHWVPAKGKSANFKKFVAKYGDRAYELEALDPAERSKLLEEAIRSVIDIEAYNREVEAERADAQRLRALREQAAKAMAEVSIDDNGAAGRAGRRPGRG